MRTGLLATMILIACGESSSRHDGATSTGSRPQTTSGSSEVGETGPASSSTSTTTDGTAGTFGRDTDSDTTSEESTGAERNTPYPDLSLGPYPSLLALVIDSMLANAANLDTGTTYSHSAAQGYVLQAIGELLWDARDHDLPERDLLIETALAEVDELVASSEQVLGGGPAFGLEDAWDAFGDGSINPALTAYTWQSGMVALGVAKLVRVLDHQDHPEVGEVRAFAEALVLRWDAHYTATADGGYWWYSTQSSDAIAVHNTSALVAMASQILSESGSGPAFARRPSATADLLWARMSGNPSTGYAWNYADDGIAPALRRAEDVSHAAITLQLMREAGQRGWWSPSQMQGVSTTLRDVMWSDHPARLHGFVDGTPGTDSAWSWSRAAVIGYAAHSDAPGGDPLVFELGRSLLFSSYLSRFERPLRGGTVDSARTLALALLLTHRPESLISGSVWETVAGPGDDTPSATPGGVRFYTVDWGLPTDLDRGLVLPSRTSTAPNANFLVDLDGNEARVVVSLTYAAELSGQLQQFDGAQYVTIGQLPATRDDEGIVRWMRASFVLGPERFDHQDGVAGTNILLQLTHPTVSVHRLEASPL